MAGIVCTSSLKIQLSETRSHSFHQRVNDGQSWTSCGHQPVLYVNNGPSIQPDVGSRREDRFLNERFLLCIKNKSNCKYFSSWKVSSSWHRSCVIIIILKTVVTNQNYIYIYIFIINLNVASSGVRSNMRSVSSLETELLLYDEAFSSGEKAGLNFQKMISSVNESALLCHSGGGDAIKKTNGRAINQRKMCMRCYNYFWCDSFKRYLIIVFSNGLSTVTLIQ